MSKMPLPQDLNDLTFFVAVVKDGGFSAAARTLQVPKSRVSRRIAALEARLDVRLIERSTRRFNVTPIGQDIFQHARAAMLEVDAIEDLASRMKSAPQGLVRMGCPMGIERLLAAALPAFLDKHPRLRVQIVVTNRRIDLIDEGVDIAIRAREKLDDDGDLQMRAIMRAGAILVASPAFLHHHGRPADPAALANLPTLCQTDRPGEARWSLIDESGMEAQVTHDPRVAATEFAILRQAAIDGLGVAMLAEYTCRAAIADGRLERVLPRWAGKEATLHIVYPSRRGLLPSVRTTIDFLIDTLGPTSSAWGVAA